MVPRVPAVPQDSMAAPEPKASLDRADTTVEQELKANRDQ